ncbi:amino acid adenylation domain-containing protein [Actinomadura viridis]|uniref:non-ribosomal peptide synthetase n=1 Tax=Actinomadura viridis TaxID=58110 RepID=UPI00368486C1
MDVATDPVLHGFFTLQVQMSHAKIKKLAATSRTTLHMFESEQAVQVSDNKIERPARSNSSERHLLLHEWNSPAAQRDGGDLLLHQLVERWVESDPSSVAMWFDGDELTYGALGAAADQVARHLRAAFGIGPDIVIGLLLDRGLHLPVAQLGVLKAGGAWLPLDTLYPKERIARQLADAGARLAITTTDLADLLPRSVPRLCLDDPSSMVGSFSTPDVSGSDRPNPDHLAYVIYTSGSTGTPKGVMISHRAAVNFIHNAVELFRLRPADHILQFTNPAFDVSVFDFFAALGSGATVVGAPREVLLDVDALQELMIEQRVTVADLPPAVLRLLDPAPLTDLRALFVGLEAFPAALVNRWRTPEREFHNGYGPTEATVTCVDYLCPPEPLDTPPPIGRPMTNHRCYVLDEDFDLVPVGAPGELFLAGTGLARGYLGRPDLTAERFLPDPFSATGERMYRTGDMVRWRADGQLEFLGRTDRQVKIRGLRVELAEVEHALDDCCGVSQSVAVVRDQGSPQAQLVAYVVATPGVSIDTEEIRVELMDRLPLHMVPAVVFELDRLPLTAGGKIDHARLRSMATSASGH